MLVDPPGIEQKVFDLCIVGCGPAGILLAMEFARKCPSKSVLIVEYSGGGPIRNRLDDTIVNKNPVNHHDPYECTNKGIGGTTATWGGRCVMYDAVDFVPHGPIQEECTWGPDFLEGLQSYIDTTCDYFHCGRGGFELIDEGNGIRPIAEGFRDGAVTSTRLERWSLPTRFGREYSKSLRESKSVFLLTEYEARDFGTLDEGQSVRTLSACERKSGATIQIRAGAFVLCNGGQEATRMLLRNKQLFSALGQVPDALGRYYQGHVSGKIALVKFFGDPNSTEYGYSRFRSSAFCRRRFQFSDQAIHENGLLNIAFWLDNPPVYDPSHRNGILSLIYLAMISPGLRNRLLPPAIARTLTANRSSEIGQHLWNVIKDVPHSLIVPAGIFCKRYFPKRRLPGVHLKSRENLYALHFHCEQMPLATNRMSLGEDGYSLEIEYRYCDREISLVIDSHRLLGEELARQNCGELRYLYPEEDLFEATRSQSKDGLHQVGTTRIAKSPTGGVVDEHLRLFGTKNVFVCSSSVFPTSGQANPTFMLGVCAVRLADHLASNWLSRIA
jgi:hypothetical protein